MIFIQTILSISLCMRKSLHQRTNKEPKKSLNCSAMGGDTFKNDEESSAYLKFSRSSSSPPCSWCFSDDLGFKDDVSEENFPKFSNHAFDLRRREKVYQEILQSHDLLLKSSKSKLKQARNQILSYTPGSWSDVKLDVYDVPKTTTILIVGPKGAGKSSLVNRITKVIEDDEFSPARAQESYGMASKGGTFFAQEYMIPRGNSASFSLYDTPGLSHIASSDNTSKIKQWVTQGVHPGEPVIWTSDSSDLTDRVIRDGGTGCEKRNVNSVIFVVNAVEILKSMESETGYARMISAAFNSPLLTFKDDKPAVVMTHGDMLLREECARVQVFLGELLGIPPDKQIFDIPESRDIATALTICNLLRYSLEHSDKNLLFLPKRNFTLSKVGGEPKRNKLLVSVLSILLVIFVACSVVRYVEYREAEEAQQKLHIIPTPPLNNLMHEVQPKHFIEPQRVIEGPNLARVPKPESESMPGGEPSIEGKVADAEPNFDWRTTRGFWFDEGKAPETEPSFDWRTTRRLWYAE